MCSFDQEFILCKCEADELLESEVGWKLTRVYSHINAKGRLNSKFVAKVREPYELLTHKLNSENCFDFEYKPSEGDRLELRAFVEAVGEDVWFTFRYYDGDGWRKASSFQRVKSSEQLYAGKLTPVE